MDIETYERTIASLNDSVALFLFKGDGNKYDKTQYLPYDISGDDLMEAWCNFFFSDDNVSGGEAKMKEFLDIDFLFKYKIPKWARASKRTYFLHIYSWLAPTWLSDYKNNINVYIQVRPAEPHETVENLVYHYSEIQELKQEEEYQTWYRRGYVTARQFCFHVFELQKRFPNAEFIYNRRTIRSILPRDKGMFEIEPAFSEEIKYLVKARTRINIHDYP